MPIRLLRPQVKGLVERSAYLAIITPGWIPMPDIRSQAFFGIVHVRGNKSICIVLYKGEVIDLADNGLC